MGRVVEAEDKLLQYLQNLSKNYADCYTVGLISGQPAQTKDFIVHLARTPEPKRNDTGDETETTKIADTTYVPKTSLAQISDSWVANHALYMTRMLPGGMFVLGIFVVSPDDLFEDKAKMVKVRSMLSQLYKMLTMNKYLYAVPEDPSGVDKLVLHYNTNTLKYTCKNVEVNQQNKAGAVTSVDWRFVPQSQSPNWYQLNCYYELDDIFPLKINNNEVSIKCQYESILNSIAKVVWSATMFVDGEVKDKEDTLESILKQKKSSSKKSITSESNEQLERNLSISMFVPSDSSTHDQDIQSVKLPGSVSFSGVVSSSVWMHHKCALSDAHNAIRSDIMRSLQARIQICCDSLDNDTVEDRVLISEPPRRVLIPLQSKVCFSDYIFNGEGASEAVLSAQEILDLIIPEEEIIADIENPADDTAICNNELSEESLEDKQDTHTIMIISGVVVAVIVLLLSIFINFYTSIFR